MGNNSNQWVKHTIAYFSVWLFLLIRVPAQSIAPSTVDTAAINQAYAIGFGLLTVNNDSAKAYSQKIISQSRRLNYPYGLARGYALAGAVMRNRGEFDSSIYYAQKALTIFETQSRPDGTASVYNLLALTYKRMGDAQKVKPLRQKALKYAEMARQSALKTHNYSELSRAYNTFGITYRDLGRFDSSKVYYHRAMRVEQQQRPQPSYLPIIYANYGQILMDADKNYAGAIQFFQKAIPLYQLQHSLTGLEHAYRNLSWAYRQQGKLKQAVLTADKALALGRTINDPHRLFNSLQAAYLAYREARQFEKALTFLEEWKHREDSLVNIEKTQAIARLESTYESRQKEAQIRQLAQENRQDRRQLAYLTAGLAIVLLLLGILGWQYRILRHSRLRIRQQATQLALTMKELHHRVKNNLAIVASLLRLQANQLPDPHVAQAIRTGQQRVEAMALIHQRLYQTDDITTVDMLEYLTDLAHSLMHAYGYQADTVRLQLDIEKQDLDVDVAIPLGLIVNELVTNAFKHAYIRQQDPFLRIGLRKNKDPLVPGITLEVQDNGPGLEAANWHSNVTNRVSFGSRLVTSLSEQLEGKFELLKENGTLFRLHIPETRLTI